MFHVVNLVLQGLPQRREASHCPQKPQQNECHNPVFLHWKKFFSGKQIFEIELGRGVFPARTPEPISESRCSSQLTTQTLLKYIVKLSFKGNNHLKFIPF